MILSLRHRHRRVFAVLGVLLPIAFVTGIAARRPVPNAETLPKELAASAKQFTATEWERSDLFSKNLIEVRLLREKAGAGRFAVSLSAPGNFAKPDLMVYWVEGNPIINDALPDNARLLGAFSAPALPLPEDVSSGSSNGMLVLFSLADQEIEEVSRLFQFYPVTIF